MCSLTHTIVVLVVICIGFFSFQLENVSARWERGETLYVRRSRVLNAVTLDETNMPMDISPPPAMTFDPNQSEKRPVKGGSDPIHNRCYGC
ncbi:hypothetical protein ACS0TY_006855 [Phlomoides rotata]